MTREEATLPREVEEPRLTERDLEAFSPDARDFLLELLLFKSIFMGKWFERLGTTGELSDDRGDFTRLAEETRAQAKATVEQLRDWGKFPGAPDRLQPATRLLRKRLFESLLAFKGASTEVYLAAAMQAPTEELRATFKELADRDRQHADRLRTMLGTRPLREILAEESGGRTNNAPLGAHGGRDEDGSLVYNIEETIQRLQRTGAVPRRIVLGPVGLRHVRDEGALNEQIGTLFDLPLDVDLAWQDECYAVETADRTTVAEIITTVRRGERVGD